MDTSAYQVFLGLCFLGAAAHAYTKLSPYFAVTWFGSGLVFAYVWAGQSAKPEVLLLPALVFYIAAAATKGVVETRARLAGNHVVHVLATGLFSGVVALPVLAAAGTAGWALPGGVPSLDWTGRLDPAWFGDVDPDRIVLWMLAGLVFYGTYKILDHLGLGRPLQTFVLFGAAPFLPRVIGAVVG